MKKRIWALLLAAVLAVGLVGCGGEPSAENPSSDEVKIYPENVEKYISITGLGAPPKTIFTTTGEENGLGGTMYKIEGKVTEVYTDEESEAEIGYFVVKISGGKVAIMDTTKTLVGRGSSIGLTKEKLSPYFIMPSVGEDVCVYAEYAGFSEVFKQATFYYGGTEYIEEVSADIAENESEKEKTDSEKPEASTNSTPTYEISEDDKIEGAEIGNNKEPDSKTNVVSTPTMGQRNAVLKAKEYLDYTAFSEKGLMEQLEYEGFSKEEATYGAKNSGADWNEQAAKKAKEYLDYSSFSRSGLIDQLLYEGFTKEQAEYGVSTVGY